MIQDVSPALQTTESHHKAALSSSSLHHLSLKAQAPPCPGSRFTHLPWLWHSESGTPTLLTPLSLSQYLSPWAQGPLGLRLFSNLIPAHFLFWEVQVHGHAAEKEGRSPFESLRPGFCACEPVWVTSCVCRRNGSTCCPIGGWQSGEARGSQAHSQRRALPITWIWVREEGRGARSLGQVLDVHHGTALVWMLEGVQLHGGLRRPGPVPGEFVCCLLTTTAGCPSAILPGSGLHSLASCLQVHTCLTKSQARAFQVLKCESSPLTPWASVSPLGKDVISLRFSKEGVASPKALTSCSGMKILCVSVPHPQCRIPRISLRKALGSGSLLLGG